MKANKLLWRELGKIVILYKYMSFNLACSVMDNSSIGFSCLEDLNDPFEGTAIGFEESEALSSQQQKKT